MFFHLRTEQQAPSWTQRATLTRSLWQHLDLDFSVFRTVRKIFLFLINCLVCGPDRISVDVIK
jgi:hypothetical protein